MTPTLTSYLTHPSYDDIHEGCYEFVKTEAILPDVIVGLLRGGMFNAVLMSHMWCDIPVIALDYSSTQGEGDQSDNHENIVPEFPHPLSRFQGLRVLLVDDICDSGYTMKEVVEVYESRGHQVRTYASFCKLTSAYQPSGRTFTIPEDAPWIIFPWENVMIQ